MMGETGPCGPCSEIHIDLTPEDRTPELELRGSKLVNGSDARCIEIWNNVFIQFNANPDGTFTPLPAQHVDTGMGFERLTSIIQGTKNFTDFANAKISNYETDIFRPIFDEIEKLSGKKYGCTLPQPNAAGQVIPETEQEKIDVAFRVIGDHIRTLSFGVADGIEPGNNVRNYVLRRILRRAVRYGRTLGFKDPFFYKLVPVLAREFGDVFPEIREKQKHIQEVLKREEESFNRTLDKGIDLFEREASRLKSTPGANSISGAFAFRLADEQGFPIDLTELMARERGLTVDKEGFNKLLQEQKDRSAADGKGGRIVIELSEIETKSPTHFLGYDHGHTGADVQEVLSLKGETVVIANNSVCYAEMGGQVGDTGEIVRGGNVWRIARTQKSGNIWLHVLEENDAPAVGDHVTIQVDGGRRAAIQRHHSVTHLLHWALHEVVSKEATQKGSFVGPDKLTFDFNSAALTPVQVRNIERLVNERIVENAGISWTEVPYADVRGNPQIMQFFGDKYGETVRVVQIGGAAHKLDGYSMELCAGTHTRATGEIGLFRINSEAAIAAGLRRIEAQAGLNAYNLATQDTARLHALATKIGTPLPELEKRIDTMLAQQKELEKALKAAQQREAAGRAKDMLAKAETINGTPAIIANLGAVDGDTLQTITDALKSHGFRGVTVLGGAANGAVALVASVSADFTAKVQAGKIIQTIAPIVGGKGGGKPDNARGGGKDAAKLDEALKKAAELLAS
jgi:alanyl-tRNA synthetase